LANVELEKRIKGNRMLRNCYIYVKFGEIGFLLLIKFWSGLNRLVQYFKLKLIRLKKYQSVNYLYLVALKDIISMHFASEIIFEPLR